LGDPLQLREDEDCTYHRLKSQIYDFNDDIVAREICLANHTYQITATGKPWRILRKHMKTLSQVWMVFMLANMVPNDHVSGLNIPRCHLLYFLLKYYYFVDGKNTEENGGFFGLRLDREKSERESKKIASEWKKIII